MSKIWQPKNYKNSNLFKFELFLKSGFKKRFKDYSEMHHWSIVKNDEFWLSISRFFKIEFEKSVDGEIFTFYVDSWRWIKTTKQILTDLSSQNKIIKSNLNGKKTTAIIGNYKHIDNTLIVTLSSGSFDTLCNILSYLQNFAFENNYERIQILTNKKLEFFDSLDYKISFYLMKKSLD